MLIFLLLILNNYYLIEIHEKYFESFYTKLKMYKLRSKVDFKENKEFMLSFIFFVNKIQTSLNKNIIFFKDPRNKKLGVQRYMPKRNLIL